MCEISRCLVHRCWSWHFPDKPYCEGFFWYTISSNFLCVLALNLCVHMQYTSLSTPLINRWILKLAQQSTLGEATAFVWILCGLDPSQGKMMVIAVDHK